jgi:hypothetical protein
LSDYTYDISSDTLNGRANIEILVREISDAGLLSGSPFLGAKIEGGVSSGDLSGVVSGGELIVSWTGTLSGPDESAQDAIIASHAGDGFIVEAQSEESLGVSSTGSSALKISLSSGPLAAGDYEVTGFADIRAQAVVANSHVMGTILLDSAELIEHSTPSDSFESFGIASIVSFSAGDTPELEIWVQVVGDPNVAEIMNARLGLGRVN